MSTAKYVLPYKILSKFKFIFTQLFFSFTQLWDREIAHFTKKLVEQYSKYLILSFVKQILSFGSSGGF